MDSLTRSNRAVCLMSSDFQRKIFVFPDIGNKDFEVKEKSEILGKQIFDHLMAYADSYTECGLDEPVVKAIKQVEDHLRALIVHCPSDKEWIVKTADVAGVKFMRAVDRAMKYALEQHVEGGNVPFRILDIRATRPKISDGCYGLGTRIDNFFGGANAGMSEVRTGVDENYKMPFKTEKPEVINGGRSIEHQSSVSGLPKGPNSDREGTVPVRNGENADSGGTESSGGNSSEDTENV